MAKLKRRPAATVPDWSEAWPEDEGPMPNPSNAVALARWRQIRSARRRRDVGTDDDPRHGLGGRAPHLATLIGGHPGRRRASHD
jgi:hypothetical protein